jgi:cytochrome c556
MRCKRVGVPTIGIVAIVLAAWGLAASAQPQGPSKQKVKPFKPVQPIQELMAGQKKLYSEIKDGILDQTWDEATTSAWILAEISNVNHYQRDDSKYQKTADRLSAEAVALARILEKKDQQSALEAAAKIGRTCKACHDEFRKE